MRSRTPRLVLALGLLLACFTAMTADAQRGGTRRPPPTPRAQPRPPAPRPPAVRGQFVFIGGYFYDPFFGPYPWWMRDVYPYRYFPIYDLRAEVRLRVTPRSTAVYVDGFYAGIVDDFDGFFQALPLPPGGHTIELFLEGHRTIRRSLYLAPGSTLTVHETMAPLAPGTTAEPPQVAPAVPMPPEGTFRPPVTPPRTPPPAHTPATVKAESFGTLQLTVQPPTATVTVDGAPWVSSDGGRFVIEVPEGRHHVEVSEPGYARFSGDVDVRAGQPTPVNVSLMKS